MKLHQNSLFLFLFLSILFKSSHGNVYSGGRGQEEKGAGVDQNDVEEAVEKADKVAHHGHTSVHINFIVLRPNAHDNHKIEAKINDFVHKLNGAFKDWFKFSYKGGVFVYDDYCYKRDLIRESDHSYCNKKLFSYRKGGCDTLNYIIVGHKGHYGDACGYYPWMCHKHRGTDSVWFKDNFNFGDIMAETGAWLGLLYTWGYWNDKHGCYDKNDHVGDTAPSRTFYHSYFNKHGHCYQEHSCGHGHKDAIDNYMGPAGSHCRKKFTHGQFARAWDMFWLYRKTYHHRALRHSEEK